MTALTHEVLKDMALPSGSPPVEPSAPIVDAMTPKDLASQSLNIHPRAAEMAEKVRAWLQKNGDDWGILIKMVKGREDPIKRIRGYWMFADPSTILALELEYHDSPLWLNTPLENRFKRFLCKENADLLKLDNTRWFVMEKSKPVQEVMSPEELASVSEKPYFVPYKSIHTGDEGMALKIDFPEKITPEQWGKINRLMVQKGYDMRGAADTQRSVYGFLQRFGRNVIPPVLQPWIDTIALVLDVKAPSQSPDVKTAGATPESMVFRRAVKEWGITHDPRLAGYVLPSGVMLDLSGRNQGGGSNRAYDHRQVGQFFDENFPSNTEAMHAFMDLGAIRWMPESGSIDIRVPPTPRQLTALRYLFRHLQEKSVFVDVFWPDYGSSDAEYKPGTNPERIVRDIQTFYKTGELPGYVNPVAQVSAAAEFIVAGLLRNGLQEFKNFSALRNVVNVLLGEEEEQLELPLDDEGGAPMSSEEIGDWLSDIGITKGFKQIGGDWGNAWEYGGTWYSAGIEADSKKWASIIHIDGLESNEQNEYWYRDAEVKARLAEPEWQARVQQVKAATYPDDEDNERAEDEVLIEIADQMNAAIEQTVYRTNAEDPKDESWVMNRLDSMILSPTGITREQWDEMGPESRVELVGSNMGWDELDHDPVKMNRKELSAYLGIEL